MTCSGKVTMEEVLTKFKKFKNSINVSLTIGVIIFTSMIIIGSMNLNNCPVEKNIPIFLIIQGEGAKIYSH